MMAEAEGPQQTISTGATRDIEKTLAQLKEIQPDIPELISFEDSLQEDGAHAVHASIWASTKESLFDLESECQTGLRVRSIVLMHLRHDGHLGFPGGMVDEPLTGLPIAEAQDKAIRALERELEEELNFDTKKHTVNSNNYIFSIRSSNNRKKPLFLHFYWCQVSVDEIPEVERRGLNSYEHGREVLGNIRVPLFTMSDGYRGFPAFLNNVFLGSTQFRLLFFLLHFGIMSKEEIKTAVLSSANHV